MEFLKNKIFIVLLFLSTLTFSQSITYSYIDPCTKQFKKIEVPSQNGTFPITINYYNQVQNFSPQQLQNGEFDVWANSIYDKYGKDNPCSSIGFNTITDNILNTSNIIVTNVLSLNTLITTVGNFGGTATSSTSTTSSVPEEKSPDSG
jgi:hypothetical protein